MNSENQKQKLIALQSLGEAHLYVSIAKADGVVSDKERIYTVYYAMKAQRLFDKVNSNSELTASVKTDITNIINNPAYASWSADNHLDEAVKTFNLAKSQGNWSTAMAIFKHEATLLETALIDGYVYKESVFLKKILTRLEKEVAGGKMNQ